VSARERSLATVRLPRADLERLTSAATAFCVMQRVALEQRIPLPLEERLRRSEDAHATLDGVAVTVRAADLDRDLDACEAAVIATRRLLGWRR
jgi:hypothetical protein